jgi:alcohol dehydrogenase (cytochrome c)
VATDHDAGAVRWRYQAQTPILAAVTATAGGVVLSGDMNGNLLVLNAASGALVHQVRTGAPIGAGIITYEVGGRQYVAVAGGSISPICPLDPAINRVTIFRLRCSADATGIAGRERVGRQIPRYHAPCADHTARADPHPG